MSTEFIEFPELEIPSNLMDLKRVDINRMALVIKAISSKARFGILRLINHRGEATVTDIVKELNIKQSIASQHIGVLLRCNILKCKRNGRYTVYSLDKVRVKQIISAMDLLLNTI